MGIPHWITKAANEAGDEKGASVNFMDETYKKLLDQYKGGKLDEWASQVVEEVELLRDVMNAAISQVNQKMTGVAKTAAPEKPKGPPASTKEGPLDFGDERLKEEMTPPAEAPTGPLSKTPTKKLLPKMKEPETTKWKEIRFNKRTGTWQTVVTIRHTRNFLSEDEAVEFTKRAGLGD